ncbi:MAG: hypothetical protein LBC61_06195 [Candidatus Peribacteria bacterium]|nr:hypothetical protein [Candidatus Peribacteria bacterium]
MYSSVCIFGAFKIASSSLCSPNNSSFQSLFLAFIASVIPSEYKTAISQGSNFISCSFINFQMSFIIQIATQPDFIL